MTRKHTILTAPLLAAALFISAPAAPARAAGTVEERIASLERELAELKALLQARPTAETATQAPAPAPPAPDMQSPAVTAAPGVKVRLYGFARFDGAYDTGRLFPGNIALYAQPGSDSDAEWSLTGNASRIGMDLSGPDTGKMKLSGKIEFDFFGKGGDENAAAPRLRHGYLKAYWPESDFSILAGQTWDVNSSLIPFVDDAGLMWNAGNIGGRHAQLRLTKGFRAGDTERVEVAVAAARTIGDTNSITGVATDNGKDANIPTIQGRVALSTPILVADKPATIAVSGHYGQEQWDTDASNTSVAADTWSASLELSMPLTDKLLFAGECFTGANLENYWGGIGQSLGSTGNETRAEGGWAAMRYTLSPTTTVAFGGGIDDPDDSDLAAAGRAFNRTIFANVLESITPNFIIGLQLSEWKTGYVGGSDSDVWRTQTSLTYKF
ncbi:DcaP family trimeric outer membrane transporter [Chlorobium sp. N1]|uniref:DcaP family trimeric outer membrane transporter n=1 Tax=Chlorobium sp. N1 TaxID=2491138 RepID=UPI00103FF197|nr:DcaP family trimeric outer membrane transporter [Chlorobium sp. N1]TCD48756.1 hypothetical protein E0L29_02420 [Chlorobium sp. N1]